MQVPLYGNEFVIPLVFFLVEFFNMVFRSFVAHRVLVLIRYFGVVGYQEIHRVATRQERRISPMARGIMLRQCFRAVTAPTI